MGEGIWLVYENKRFRSNFDFFRFSSHLKRLKTARKMIDPLEAQEIKETGNEEGQHTRTGERPRHETDRRSNVPDRNLSEVPPELMLQSSRNHRFL